jgi:hypothetical protein
MLFGKHHHKFKIVWGVLSIIVVIGMILLYMAPMFSN